MREKLRSGLNEAVKAQDKVRAATLRLITAALKERDIDARGKGKGEVSDDEILGLLQKMVKQREESAKIYADNGRAELAAQEKAEIAIIEEYLPKMLSESEVAEAIAAVIADLGADGMKDMGRVIAELKNRFPGQVDMGKASGAVKSALAG